MENALKTIDQVALAGPFQPAWDSLKQYQVPEWYEDAKFGIFIHWGAYCVPAFGNEWYPRQMYEQGTKEFKHHVETYGPQSKCGYKDFIPLFKAEKFNPAHWAELFRQSGARFVVPVAEHHDGFPMYDCSFTEWSAAKMGPKRDIIGELAAAIRKEGLVFGLSSHRAEHYWFFSEGAKFDSDVNDPQNAGLYGPARPAPLDRHDIKDPHGPDAPFMNDWLARTGELVDKYRPQIVWFDWWIQHEAWKPYLAKFASFYYNRAAIWNKGVAINYKYDAYPEGSAVFDVERGQLKGIRPMFWQTDTSVSRNSWGYIKDHDYKTVESIVQDLVDIVSKNGALLLNIGPRPDGTIPQREQQMLLEIGQWLDINGEAIYGTRPWEIFGEGPTEVTDGAFTDTNRKAFTSQDFRFTRKGNVLYAIGMAWPSDGKATIQSLASGSKHCPGKIGSIELLGSEAKIEWTRDRDGLKIALPHQKPCAHAVVFKITPAD